MTYSLLFEDVCKFYRGSREYHGSLREDFMQGLGRVVGRRPTRRRVVPALDHVDLEVPEGDSFALIGENGAGKSTALKVATRITYPTSGTVRVRGRVGALVEVGTGLHPELTGRENIELFGSILGHTRRDIARRFDSIVEFAGVGPAIDQPVKQYSSGMELRVGFAVAAHLEPDLLLVDEAIAVGDAGFHYRCVERMSELVREGRTLVFVSHDIPAIEALCRRAVWMQDGRIKVDGPARDVVREYLLAFQTRRLEGDQFDAIWAGDELQILAVTVLDTYGREVNAVRQDEPMTVRITYRATKPIEHPQFSVGLGDGRVGCFAQASMLVDGRGPRVIEGVGHIDCTFTALPLQPKTYEIWGSVLGGSGYGDLMDWQRLRLFQVVTADDEGSGKVSVTNSMTEAPVRIPYQWSVPDERLAQRVEDLAGSEHHEPAHHGRDHASDIGIMSAEGVH